MDYIPFEAFEEEPNSGFATMQLIDHPDNHDRRDVLNMPDSKWENSSGPRTREICMI
jgi:hypothetical protein